MNAFTFRQPTPVDQALNLLRYAPAKRFGTKLNEKQMFELEQLKTNGFVVIEDLFSSDQLESMQTTLNEKLNAGNIEYPVLAQTRIDPIKHKAFIDNFLYGAPSDLRKLGVGAEKDDFKNYDQFVNDFNPSTLAVKIPDEDVTFFNIWLNEYLLDLIEAYLGLRPSLLEAYIRRNFPSPYRTMNHFWHRDLNHKFYLLKAFIFLSDCDADSGPHEFVKGSHKDYSLNGKRYFDDEEVQKNCEGKIVQSIVKKGTIVLEDTRGLHRAAMPKHGFRDLGYAVFAPVPWFRNYAHKNYNINKKTFLALTRRQKTYISDIFIDD